MSGPVGGRPRRVTSADVAKASGVSRATVSYVLNNVPGRSISDATRQLVIDTARALGHVPYAPARSLRLGHSNIVLALVRDFAIGYVSNRVLRKLDLVLAERGFVVLAHRYDSTVRPLPELWGLVTPALVVAMGGLTVPEQQVIDGTQTKLLRVHGFVPHEKAGRMQAEYLHSRGHTRLGYAFPADPTLELVASERLDGVRAACREQGLPEPSVRVIDTFDPATAASALDFWRDADEPITAVCSHNDEIAVLLASVLESRGLRAGRDLAIIGVDNIPIARVSLTTIEIDVEAWGDAVAATALALLDDEEPPPHDRDFLRLIVRESA